MHEPEEFARGNTDPLIQALEQAPAVAVPEDFASRVMARIPPKPARRVLPRSAGQTQRYGPTAAAAALVLLLAAMLLFAPRTANSGSWLAVQWLLFVEFCALLLWTGAQRLRRS